MARPTTCDIKTKPGKTFHLSEETIRLMERCHIEVEHNLGRRIEVTHFRNALITVAADHIDEIANKLRAKDSKQS